MFRNHTKGPVPRPPEDRFWEKVNKTDTCWLWTGSCNVTGYGQFWSGVTMIQAHTFLIGKSPPGLVWDHLCRVRNCIRPSHLEAVTYSINTLRGINHHRLKTHCLRGHPFTEDNVYHPRLKPNARGCRECMRQRTKAAMKRLRLKLQTNPDTSTIAS